MESLTPYPDLPPSTRAFVLNRKHAAFVSHVYDANPGMHKKIDLALQHESLTKKCDRVLSTKEICELCCLRSNHCTHGACPKFSREEISHRIFYILSFPHASLICTYCASTKLFSVIKQLLEGHDSDSKTPALDQLCPEHPSYSLLVEKVFRLVVLNLGILHVSRRKNIKLLEPCKSETVPNRLNLPPLEKHIKTENSGETQFQEVIPKSIESPSFENLL